ncbi:hypothetical protein PR048_010549 [Dryococelus australis]|uniref:Uncharacterized protein n=1 Tax=Dryococelus australis TaxID=614101 RepID=A0ABQ9I450_9NEOP|nr:hypothetical protein PR048_010549 [Dryococelus australis]
MQVHLKQDFQKRSLYRKKTAREAISSVETKKCEGGRATLPQALSRRRDYCSRGAAVPERLACSPPAKANRVLSRIFAPELDTVKRYSICRQLLGGPTPRTVALTSLGCPCQQTSELLSLVSATRGCPESPIACPCNPSLFQADPRLELSPMAATRRPEVRATLGHIKSKVASSSRRRRNEGSGLDLSRPTLLVDTHARFSDDTSLAPCSPRVKPMGAGSMPGGVQLPIFACGQRGGLAVCKNVIWHDIVLASAVSQGGLRSPPPNRRTTDGQPRDAPTDTELAVLRTTFEEVHMEQRRNARAGGNGRPPRKPTDQRHRPARFTTCENPGATPPGIEPDSPTVGRPLFPIPHEQVEVKDSSYDSERPIIKDAAAHATAPTSRINTTCGPQKGVAITSRELGVSCDLERQLGDFGAARDDCSDLRECVGEIVCSEESMASRYGNVKLATLYARSQFGTRTTAYQPSRRGYEWGVFTDEKARRGERTLARGIITSGRGEVYNMWRGRERTSEGRRGIENNKATGITCSVNLARAGREYDATASPADSHWPPSVRHSVERCKSLPSPVLLSQPRRLLNRIHVYADRTTKADHAEPMVVHISTDFLGSQFAVEFLTSGKYRRSLLFLRAENIGERSTFLRDSRRNRGRPASDWLF